MIHYPLASSTWNEEEINAIKMVIDSGMFTMGKNVYSFEKEFASFFGSKYSIMVNSGSSANLLAIASLFFKKENPLKRGDEIMVPSVSWSTTYLPLQQYGLKVKFVDIDINTLNINIDKLKAAISQETRAIFLVNLLGNPNDFGKIEELTIGKNIYLLEDNCESMGAEFLGRKTGTFGIVGTFSSFFSHHISTMEGGIITTNNEELYHILLSLRAHGWTRNLPTKNLVTGKKCSDPFYESFKFVLPGYNVRPLEMMGAIGSKQLQKLDNFISERRNNASYFIEKFANHPNIRIQTEIGKSSWFGFSLILKKGLNITRDNIVRSLQKSGIETRPIVGGNFVKNLVIKYFDYSIFDELTNADDLDTNGFFVGNHHYPIMEQIAYLEKKLNILFANLKANK